MKRTKFQRLAALILMLTILFGGGAISTAAADNGEEAVADGESSTTNKRLSDIKELLNTISYDEYLESYELYYKIHADEVRTPSKSVSFNAVDVLSTEKTDADLYLTAEELQTVTNYSERSTHVFVGTFNGVEAVYTPSDGEVSYVVNIPQSGMYTITLDYYPVAQLDKSVTGNGDDEAADVGKAASIERIFKIDGAVPFKEARYLSLNKNWQSSYVDAQYELKKDESADSFIAEAKKAGLEAYKSTDKDGVVLVKYPAYWTAAMTEFCDENVIRFFTIDRESNEIRTAAVQTPEWTDYTLHDSSGYYTQAFEFYLAAGERVITIEGVNEPMVVSKLTFDPASSLPTYEEYIAKVSKYPDNTSASTAEIKLEAEFAYATSSKTIYQVEDRSDAVTSPSDTSRTLLNTIGGEKWETAGQYIDYRFSVSESGLYDVFTRFKQDILDGMYVCRSLSLFSYGIEEGQPGYANGVPFEEASRLRYDYGSKWKVTALTDGSSDVRENGYQLYLAAGEGVYYTLRFEVTLGSMGDIVREVEAVLTSINEDYLNIRKLTGTNPDSYRDYGFSRVMPDTLIDMIVQSRVLDNSDNEDKAGYTPGMAERLTEMAGQKSSNVATLQKVSSLLNKMGTDEDEVAKNLSNLKTYIGNLGTFLSDAKTQPLQLDYIIIRASADTSAAPKATANFFEFLWHEIESFFMSFFRDYNSMGAIDENTDEGIEVWLAYGRDQSQVIRNLINNQFTPETGVTVDLKLVAGGTLLPSILAGSGPDVYLGLDQGTIINYAIRSALLDIKDCEITYNKEAYAAGTTSEQAFRTVTASFTDAAISVLGIADADEIMHYYGLPETQSFTMMFVRDDVLANMNVEIPKTWDDIMAAIPILQSKNMEIGLQVDYNVHLYQNGGSQFADDGMRINLDSKKGLAAFEKMCSFFVDYSFPYQYDAANRFRTGEMPILISDYTGMYNQLKVFATEIEGMWEFLPMPGTVQEDGTINNVSMSSVSAVVMVSGTEEADKGNAWKYMKWYTGADCQIDYSNEMVAILGPSAKHATANTDALKLLPWTTSEYEAVSTQFNNLAAIPNYPGAYIIGRYTSFAFLAAYNEKKDPSESILAYISTINKEISRKRTEFGLETLESGETLASKRMSQASEIINRIIKDGKYNYSYNLELALQAITSGDIAALNTAAENVEAALAQLDPDGSKFSAELKDTMGYDMYDTTLTKDQKEKARKCYYYEAYQHSDGLISQLHFAAEFMRAAANALSTY